MGLIRCLVVIVALIEVATAATTHEVGGSLGWTEPPNTTYYSEWASTKTFAVGDTLVFTWTGTHDVLEVTSMAEYAGCTKTNGEPKVTSPVNVNLTGVAARYFICTIANHCVNGQKLTVTVTSTNSTTPAGSPGTNTTTPAGGSASMPTAGVLSAILSTIAISFFTI